MTRRPLTASLLAGLAVVATLGLSACGHGAGAALGSSAAPASVSLASDTLVDATDSMSGTSSAPSGVPASGRCTAQQRWTALAQVAPQVESYLNAHPDVAAEIDHLRSLPVDQRRDEAASWVAAHPQYQAQVDQLRTRLAHYRATCSVG
jgi:heme-binding protein